MRKQQTIAVTLVCALLALNGCALFLIGAGAAAGAGAVAYVAGELKADDQASMDQAWHASLRAMDDLQFKVTKTQKDALNGLMVVRRADDTRIVIRLKKESDRVTEIRIRVGVFGDEDLSRMIHQKIMSHF